MSLGCIVVLRSVRVLMLVELPYKPDLSLSEERGSGQVQILARHIATGSVIEKSGLLSDAAVACHHE